MLEESFYQGRTADFAWLLLYSAVSLIVRLLFLIPARNQNYDYKIHPLTFIDFISGALSDNSHALSWLSPVLLPCLHLGSQESWRPPLLPRPLRLQCTLSPLGPPHVLRPPPQQHSQRRLTRDCYWSWYVPKLLRPPRSHTMLTSMSLQQSTTSFPTFTHASGTVLVHLTLPNSGAGYSPKPLPPYRYLHQRQELK